MIDKLIGECHAMSLDRYLDTFYDRLYASVAVASSHNTINQKIIKSLSIKLSSSHCYTQLNVFHSTLIVGNVQYRNDC